MRQGQIQNLLLPLSLYFLHYQALWLVEPSMKWITISIFPLVNWDSEQNLDMFSEASVGHILPLISPITSQVATARALCGPCPFRYGLHGFQLDHDQ